VVVKEVVVKEVVVMVEVVMVCGCGRGQSWTSARSPLAFFSGVAFAESLNGSKRLKGTWSGLGFGFGSGLGLGLGLGLGFGLGSGLGIGLGLAGRGSKRLKGSGGL